MASSATYSPESPETNAAGGVTGAGSANNDVEEPIVWNTEREAEDYQLVEGPSFKRTLKTLLWKDYQQFCKSRKKSFCCRMTCPIICILLMAYFRLFLAVVPYSENIFNLNTFDTSTGDGPSVSVYPPNTDIRWMLEEMLCIYEDYNLPPGYFVISPNPNDCASSENEFTDAQCEHLQAMVDILNMTYTYYFNQDTGYYDENGSYIDEGRSSWGWGDCADYFDDLKFEDGWLVAFFNGNDEINEYISSNDYGSDYDVDGSTDYVSNSNRPINVAIVFNSISDDGLQWDYTIRMNDTESPNTNNVVNKFERNIWELYWNGYGPYDWGEFTNVQEWMDQCISYYIANITDNADSELSIFVFVFFCFFCLCTCVVCVIFVVVFLCC